MEHSCLSVSLRGCVPAFWHLHLCFGVGHTLPELPLLCTHMYPDLLHRAAKFRTDRRSMGDLDLGLLSLCYLFCERGDLGNLPRHACDGAGPLVHPSNGRRNECAAVGQLRFAMGPGGA